MELNWLTPALKKEVKTHFEARLGEELSDEEVQDLALKLTEYTEFICQWKMKHESTRTSRKNISSIKA